MGGSPRKRGIKPQPRNQSLLACQTDGGRNLTGGDRAPVIETSGQSTTGSEDALRILAQLKQNQKKANRWSGIELNELSRNNRFKLI